MHLPIVLQAGRNSLALIRFVVCKPDRACSQVQHVSPGSVHNSGRFSLCYRLCGVLPFLVHKVHPFLAGLVLIKTYGQQSQDESSKKRNGWQPTHAVWRSVRRITGGTGTNPDDDMMGGPPVIQGAGGGVNAERQSVGGDGICSRDRVVSPELSLFFVLSHELLRLM